MGATKFPPFIPALLLAVLPAFHAGGQLQPFANDIPPQLTFEEHLEQGGARIPGDDYTYLVYKSPTLPPRVTINAAFSLTGIDLAALGRGTSFSLDGGNLSIYGTLGEDATYAPGKTKAKIYLDGDLGSGYHQGASGTIGFIELDWSDRRTLKVYVKINDCTPDYYLVAGEFEDNNDLLVNAAHPYDREVLERDPNSYYVDGLEFIFGNRYFADRVAYYSGTVEVEFRAAGIYDAEEEEYDTISITGGLSMPTTFVDAPADGAAIAAPTTTVTGRAVVESGIGLDTVLLTVNGTAEIDATIAFPPLAGVPSAGFETWNWTATGVPLAPGANTITAVTTDADGAESPVVSRSLTRLKIDPVAFIDTPAEDAVIRGPAVTVTGRVVVENGVPVTAVAVAVNGGAPTAATVAGPPAIGVPGAGFDTWDWTATDIPLAPGANTITALATDADGAVSPLVTRHVLRPATINVTLAVLSGTAGTAVAGEPPGTYLSAVGIPAINDAGQLAFMGTLNLGATSTPAVLAGAAPAVVTRKGDAAPGVAGATFASFRDPLLDQRGAVAFVAKVSGPGVTTADDYSLWSDAFGAGLQMVAREGQPAAGTTGASIATFVAIAIDAAGEDAAVAYVGKLKGPTISSADDSGLWAFDGTTTRLLLREGMSMAVDGSPRVLRRFKALGKVALAAGHGFTLSHGAMTALLAFADGTSAVATLSTAGGDPVIVALENDAAPGHVAAATFGSFLAPGQNSRGKAVFTAGIRGTAPADNAAVYAVTGSGAGALGPVAIKGAAAPGVPDAAFSGFAVAVLNADDLVACKGKMAGAGVSAASKTGIWLWENGVGRLLARENAEAADTPAGTRWDDFSELALPDGGRPLFIARLLVGSGNPAATKADDLGLWAANSGGTTRLIVREGVTTVNGKTVTSFRTLSAASGSPGQTRSHNGSGGIVYWARFADGTDGIVTVELP